MRIPLTLLLCAALPVLAEPMIVGHPNLAPLDRETLQRIYTGKVVEVNGARVTPVNLTPGNELRARFLRDYLGQDEDKYTGYWTVRRYVGKGAPPREFGTTGEVKQFIARTPGAIGYIDETELTSDARILLRMTP
ncbi:hypothetical protein CCR95_05185 [Thiocystis minor]|uniref:hypothetical protein n=1 Tax=Thiocystis minor TaxID=61597 RepID=UPI0019114BBA|nr:hypothetical protein [Thiocystis minor]MBK5963498.1 hypothetical protein [Thiocystis minor]